MGKDKSRRLINSVWDDLKEYQNGAYNSGVINWVFVGSMQDILEKSFEIIHIKK